MSTLFVTLFISLFAFSHVIKDDVQTTDKFIFKFGDVCSKMVAHESPPIDPLSVTTLDCMGSKVSVSEFCNRELAHDPYYIRGYISAKNNHVVCHSGKKVIFNYLCDHQEAKDKELCGANAKVSCLKLKEKIAYRLDLVKAEKIKTEKGETQLNCSYESLPLKGRAF